MEPAGFTDKAGFQTKPRRMLLLSTLLLSVFASMASTATAAELPPYELDPALSLTGNCAANAFDPIPDPSCAGQPPAYPPPPGGPVGRFDEPGAIAIDPYGNEYVASFAGADPAKGRVDVFDDEGHFITEVAVPGAKNIAVDSKGNLYAFSSLGVVTRYAPELPYEPEAGGIKYDDLPVTVTNGSFVGAIAVDVSNDHLIVAHGGNITEYESAEEGNDLVESFKPASIGPWTEAIAVDSQRRRIYVSYCTNITDDCAVKVVGADPPHAVLADLDGSNTPVGEFTANQGRLGLAVDEETGDPFVGDIQSAKTVYRFNEDYEYLSQFKSDEFAATTLIQIAVSNGERAGADAFNRHYLFVPKVISAGRAIAFKPPGQLPPEILGASPVGIAETEAQLRAEIDPRGADTDYLFEYTTQAAFEAEGFTGATIAGSGTISGESLAKGVGAIATGLIPATAYRFRVVAENEIGKASEAGQNEARFATYDDAPAPGGCPNQASRLGNSAQLPDCRAYELVTPPDTNGRSPRGVFYYSFPFTTVHSTPAGDAVSFKIEGGSLPGSSGVGSFSGGDPYVARRGASGWSTSLAGPSGTEATAIASGSTSPDQGYSLWTANGEGPAVISAAFGNQYLRYPDGHSELVGRGSLGFDPTALAQLVTEDGTHVIFKTFRLGDTPPVQLEPNAPATDTDVVYDRTIDPVTGAEQTHVVSLLPGDVTPGQDATYRGASKDGEGIAFAIGNTLYLRVGNETTYEVGENVAFAGISEGGERIFYLQGGDLRALDTASEEVIEFSSSGDVTPVNVAGEGTRAAFISPSVLGGANPEGDLAQSGEQNLYLSTEGQVEFIATVTDRDVEGEIPPFYSTPIDGLGLWTEVVGREPANDPSRLNPDGSVLLFQSRADITGYESGEFPQIYRYGSEEGRLQCISCIPTETPASGGASLASSALDSDGPQPFGTFGFVDNMRPDGKRVLFESTEALVSADTDGVQDVYEWEDEGVGSCKRSGGCVYLISSGQSARDNFLYAHSTDGEDVFFTTVDRLTAEDPSGTPSIYDAKVEGGFVPSAAPGECLGGACQPTASAPDDPSPASVSFRGQGNVKPQGAKSRCPKGKRAVRRRGKVRCLKPKRAKRTQRKATSKRGVGR